MDRYVIITAGGTGTRMGGELPKQFMDLGGKPVLMRTIEQFRDLSQDVKIIIVLNSGTRKWWESYCEREDVHFRRVETAGGLTRFHSVQNALKYVKAGSLVAVHDGVRPFVPKAMIEKMFSMAGEYPAVLPVVEMADSMREKRDEGIVPVDRTRYFAVQTPQVFQSDVLLKSYDVPFKEEFTDDASVVEAAGYPLHYCSGSRFNIKLTRPEDMLLAGIFLNSGEVLNPNLSFDSLFE